MYDLATIQRMNREAMEAGPKTPEQIAEEMFAEDLSLGQDDKAVIIAAIKRDRAQR